MADNFLNDRAFMRKLNNYHVSETFASLEILDFKTENLITVLGGKVVSGNMNITANSVIRRTGSLTIVFDNDTFDLTDVNNLISINKKVRIKIGLTNPFYNDTNNKYDKILWFNQGIFYITQASSSISTSSASININFIDKGAKLNGLISGMFPASTSLHDYEVQDKDGNINIQYNLIYDIIKECVQHYSEEISSKILIEDVDTVGRQVVKYIGETPLCFETILDAAGNPTTERAEHGNYIISETDNKYYQDKYYNGDIVGYLETDLTYPGELIMAAGSTVGDALSKIASTLGNYEYFYDTNGCFHFRQIHNFLATGNTPLNIDFNYDTLNDYYLPVYNSTILLDEFADNSLVTSINFSPNYSNIKNDFTVWGTKETDNVKVAVRYHLVIDERPEVSDDCLCYSNIWSYVDEDGIIQGYGLRTSALPTGYTWKENVAPALPSVFGAIEQEYWFNWREELYRKALLAYGNSTRGSYYDEELLANWRDIYDPTSTSKDVGSKSFQAQWQEYFGATTPWTGYRKEVLTDPGALKYWLDLIDTSSSLGQFSVSKIGRRCTVVEDSNISQLFSREINDIVILEQDDGSEDAREKRHEKVQYYDSIGQSFAFFSDDDINLLETVSNNSTCYDRIRTELANSVIYNSSVSLTCLPLYYLDVNQVVRLNFKDFGIYGDYVINSISWSIGQNSTMNLQLTEAITMA